MRIYQAEISVKTRKYYDFLDLTEKIKEEVRKSDIKDGLVFIFLEHNTAAIFIQENDKTIFSDLKNFLEKILPLVGKYEHSYEGNINATAHLKNILISQNITIPIKNKELVLGNWQRIILVELFESRERKIFITIMGE